MRIPKIAFLLILITSAGCTTSNQNVSQGGGGGLANGLGGILNAAFYATKPGQRLSEHNYRQAMIQQQQQELALRQQELTALSLSLDISIKNDNDLPPRIKVNEYGRGVHRNQFGQPITLRPDYGGVTGESLQIKENAYGLGVHSDQYGRPVREYPWP